MSESPNELDLSIVIPARDHEAYLRSLLASIRAHMPDDLNVEILVMDDGSEHELKPLCDEFEAQVHRTDESQGPADCRNKGAAMARAELIAFFDADVVCTEDYFSTALTFMREHPEAASLSFINQPYDQRDNLVKNYGAAIEHYWFVANFAEGEDATEIKGFTTRNGIVRKAAFQAINGFDTSFKTNAHEDYDFGKRLSAGHRTFMTRSPLPYHNFPDKLTRLLRNYWVRVVLFVPYLLQHKPALDKTQSSPGEAVLRLSASAAFAFAVLAALPIPGTTLFAGAALLTFCAYLFSLHRFLLALMRWSRSWTFPLMAIPIHYISSLVITLGGVWGLLHYLMAPKRQSDSRVVD